MELTRVGSKMKVSAVIPTYNNEDTIEKCITSILNQTRKFDEIIVVDDGSTDNTSDIIKNFPVKIIRTENRGRPRTRNTGWRKAKGDVIAFIEADSYYNEIWLEENLSKLSEADMTCHRRMGWGVKNSFTKVFDKILMRRWKILIEKNDLLSGWVFKKYVLEDLNGFDESFERAQDVDIGQRALKNGFKIIPVENAIEYHKGDVPSGFVELAKRSRLQGENILPFYRRYPERFPIKILFFIALPITLFIPKLFLILFLGFYLLTSLRGVLFLKLNLFEVLYYPLISLTDNYSFLYGFMKSIPKHI